MKKVKYVVGMVGGLLAACMGSVMLVSSLKSLKAKEECTECPDEAEEDTAE